MRRADIKLLFPIAIMAALLVAVISCSNPKDPVDDTKPTVTITYPEDLALVPNSVDVRAEASDNEKVTKVEFYIDAQLYYTDNIAPWGCLWTTGMDESGEHTIYAKAFDATGNWDRSELVTVTCENTPPAAVSDLAATDPDLSGSLTLSWTAPGDDGTTGTAAVYDLRYYWAPITADNWVSAVRVEGEPTPQAAGSSETCDYSGLSLSRTFYFAIRTQDALGNWSDISNVVEVTTPDLMGGALSYAIGDNANSMTAADIDGDTYIDLAVAHLSETDNLSLLFNSGDGTFADPVVYYARRLVAAVSVADIDDDGDNDLVAANNSCDYFLTEVDSASSVSILENVGAAVFELQILDTYDTAYRYCTNIAYDPVGDSLMCTLWSQTLQENPRVLLPFSLFDSTLVDTSVVNYYADERSTALCVADIDNDLAMDIVVSNQLTTNLSVLRNNGDGTYQDPVNYACGANIPNSVCAGDFNNDGWIDLANTCGGSNQVTVFLNNGDGTIGNPENGNRNFTKDVGHAPTSICCGDVNGDGYLDLITANSLESNVSILLRNPAYNPATPSSLYLSETVRPAGRGARAAVVSDLSGDAALELVVANNYDDNVSMMASAGEFLYYSYNTVEFMAGDGPVDIECADFDGDGDNDIAVLNQNEGSILILYNQTVP